MDWIFVFTLQTLRWKSHRWNSTHFRRPLRKMDVGTWRSKSSWYPFTGNLATPWKTGQTLGTWTWVFTDWWMAISTRNGKTGPRKTYNHDKRRSSYPSCHSTGSLQLIWKNASHRHYGVALYVPFGGEEWTPCNSAEKGTPKSHLHGTKNFLCGRIFMPSAKSARSTIFSAH